MLKYPFLVFAALICLGAAACTNTVDGAGQDIENAGEAIQDSVHGR